MKNRTVEALLLVFEQFRKPPLSIDEYETKGKQILRDKFLKFVQYNRPIKFSMMGFPYKSGNTRDKVLSDKPDMAEQLTMDNFAAFEKAMQAVYPPGIRITIASDGLAFSHIFGIPELVVDQYQEINQSMAPSSLEILNLRDFYSVNDSVDNLRAKLLEQWGISPEEMQHRILFDADTNMLYTQINKFMTQELATREYPSSNQFKKGVKEHTRQVMFWNEAYSRMVQHELSDHIRLSMHPSVNNGVKYSFQLIRTPLYHHSAWHSAILVHADNTIETIHKKDAIAAGHELIYNNNQPWNFQAK